MDKKETPIYILKEDGTLQHYGVKGMKWGIRRYQPYTDGKSGKFVGDKPKRKTKKELEVRDDKAKKQALATMLGNAAGNIAIEQGIGQLVAQGMLTTPQGQAINIAINSAKKSVDSGVVAAKLDDIKGKNQWKEDKSLSGNKSVNQIQNEVIPGVNPGYGKEFGTINNCRRATVAYELRRRGHNVTARKTAFGTGATDGGMVKAINKDAKNLTGGLAEMASHGIEAIMNKASKGKANTPLYDYKKSSSEERNLSKPKRLDLFKSRFSKKTLKEVSKTTTKGMMDGLSKQPDGSRGEVTIWWPSGGGHSIAYEIVNGKPVIFDTQNSRTYTSAKQLEADGYAGTAYFTRLDNAEFNKDFVERWVKDA